MSITSVSRDIASGASAWKHACRVVATSNITLSGLQTIDGVSVASGERVLVTGQSTAAQNGPYNAFSTAWVRCDDADQSNDFQLGMTVAILSGTTYGGTTWRLTSPTTGDISVGATSLTFTQVVAGAPTSRIITAGAGLTGGGDLSADRTLNVAATNASIDVAADGIALGAAYKAQLDGATASATNSAVCQRDGSAGCAFGAVTSTAQTWTDSDASVSHARTGANVYASSVATGDTWNLRHISSTLVQLVSTGPNIFSPNNFNLIQAQDAGGTIGWAFGYVDITALGAPGLTLNTAEESAISSGGGKALLRRSGGGRVYGREYIHTVQTTDATPTNAMVFTTTSNTVYGVRLRVTASNDTDNEGFVFAWREAGFKNVAGSLTDVGGAGVTVEGTDRADTIGTANVTITRSGTTIIAEVTGIAGKTINWNLRFFLDERVLA